MSRNLIVKRKEIEDLPEKKFIHPLNDKAIRHTKSLGDIVGLNKVGFHLVRIEPGDETTQYHNHECSDEFVFILSGQATLELDEDCYSLEEGDFAGFPSNGACHSMTNTGDCDLVYLMGGDRPDIDFCNYPKIKRKLYKINEKREYVNTDQLNKL